MFLEKFQLCFGTVHNSISENFKVPLNNWKIYPKAVIATTQGHDIQSVQRAEGALLKRRWTFP